MGEIEREAKQVVMFLKLVKVCLKKRVGTSLTREVTGLRVKHF